MMTCSVFGQSVQWNWARAIHGPTDEDEIDAIASDSEASVYISGKYEDTLFINEYEDTLISSGMADIMLIKYDSSGNMLWYKNYGGSGEDNTFDADCDTENNLIISGYFQDTLIFDNDTLISNGGFDAFFVKLDPLGEVVWAKSYGGTGDEGANEVSISMSNQIISCIDSDNNFYLDTFYVENTGNRDAYIISMSDEGEVDWYRAVGGTGGARSKSVAVDLDGNVFYGGDFFGDNYVVDEFGVEHSLIYVGERDAFISCWNFNGDLKWHKAWGGSGNEYCKGLATNDYGEVFAMGPFENNVLFDGVNLTSSGLIDFFLWKLDSLGNGIWVKHLASTNSVSEGGELISDGQNGVAFGVGYSDSLEVDDLIGSQIYTTETPSVYPIFFQFNRNGELINTLECSNSVYGTTGEIARSGNLIYLDIIFAGGIILGENSLSTTPLANKDGALLRIDLLNSAANTSAPPVTNSPTIHVFPNPVNHQLFISHSNLQPIEACIMRVDGQIIHCFTLKHSESTVFDTKGLFPGVYLIRTENSTLKFIKY